MRNHRLPHYLKTCRKRVGLSQEDIAYLLGFESSAHVSRYERYRRSPIFRMALAMCVIFQLPPRELFGGEYQKVWNGPSAGGQNAWRGVSPLTSRTSLPTANWPF